MTDPADSARVALAAAEASAASATVASEAAQLAAASLEEVATRSENAVAQAAAALEAAVGVWQSYTPVLENFTTSSTIIGRYQEVGQTCTAQVRVTLDAAPTGIMRVSLPLPGRKPSSYTVLGTALAVKSGTPPKLGVCLPYDSGTSLTAVYFVGHDSNQWVSTNPWTWASGDILSLSIVFEKDGV